MGYRENDHLIRIDTIEKRVGKTGYKASSNLSPDNGPAFREIADILDCQGDGIEKISSKSIDTIFIIGSGIKHFLFRQLHHANGILHNRSRAS